MISYLRNYPFTSLCMVLIVVLSFFSPPHTPLDDVAMIDKWTHLVMYGGTMMVFCLEYFRRQRKQKHESSSDKSLKVQVIAAIALIATGGMIELLQAYCTGGRRSGEWLDWVADSLGVLLGWLAGLAINAIVRKI